MYKLVCTNLISRSPIVLKYLLFLIYLLPLMVLGGINKCIINGVTVYTDGQCPENTSQNLKISIVNKTPAELSNINERSYKSNRWYYDFKGYEEALKISVAKSASILIYGRTDWCPYCKRLDSTFLSNTEVKKVLSVFIKVKLNPEHSFRDKEFFNIWGGTGYPTLFVQSAGNSIPRKIRPTFIKQGDKWVIIRKEAFISILRDHHE